jgi:hypothetical protein
MATDRRDAASARLRQVRALQPPDVSHDQAADTPMVPEQHHCGCGCCDRLIRALAGIKVELSKIRERLDQGESERSWPA